MREGRNSRKKRLKQKNKEESEPANKDEESESANEDDCV